MQIEDEKVNLTLADVESIAQSAADRAVTSLFEKLDIDVENKDALRRFRDDLRFVREQRAGQEMLRENVKKGALYLMGTALMGLAYLSWGSVKLGIVTWLQTIR